MLIGERLVIIQEYLDKNGKASIEELENLLNVSKDTVRRDLIKLEKQKLVRRTHGGVLAPNKEAIIVNYDGRSHEYEPCKKKIAQKAVRLIHEHDIVTFDSSTTVEAVIDQLEDIPLTAITNSLTHAIHLAKFRKIEIKMIGGRLRRDHLFVYGEKTVSELSQQVADIAFIGVFSISTEGIMIHTEQEALVKKEMIKNARKVVAVTVSSKFNTTGHYKVCDLSMIDVLITDTPPDEAFIQALDEAYVELITVSKN